VSGTTFFRAGRFPRSIATIILSAFATAPGFADLPNRRTDPPPVSSETGSAAAAMPANNESRWLAVRIDNFDYVTIDALARRLELEVTWIKPDERVALAAGGRKIEFVANSREMTFDGLRVLLGQPTRWHKQTLCVSQVDADNLLTPLVRMGQERITLPKPIKTIVLDPGHGGTFNGTQNDRLKLQEKTLTLDTVQRLKTLLVARGYTVVLTRTEDRELSPDWKVDLQRRAEIAAQAKADLFLSVHFNAATENAQQISGVEVYRYTPRHQTPAGRTERRPEDDDAFPGDDYNYFSAMLGWTLQRSLVATTGAVDRGLRHDKFAVLKLAACPSALIEGGYVSNDQEARKLADPAYRARLAEAIAQGVDAYAKAMGQTLPGKN
jgi:N-acetylmuramoyl-L-alanine amidase